MNRPNELVFHNNALSEMATEWLAAHHPELIEGRKVSAIFTNVEFLGKTEHFKIVLEETKEINHEKN